MTREEQKPVKPPSPVIPLTSEQAVNAAKTVEKSGATFFDWKKFQELTKKLPPNISIAKILKEIKRK